MKLRDLARGSGNPTSLLSAFHILRCRFGNRETAKGCRKSCESVSHSTSTTLRLLTPLQQTTVVPTPRTFRRPRHPGSRDTLPIRTYHGDQNFHKSTCHRPVSLCFLIFEQGQSKVYHEVSIAGDLTEEDVNWSYNHLDTFMFSRMSSGRSTSDTVKLAYNNEAVYFAQPSLSQFIPGGSGPGTFNPSDISNNTLVLSGRDTPKSNTSAVLRYALSSRQNCSLTS